MPSGAKKRKAAKKKKEENPSNNESGAFSASIHSHGNEDVNQQDDKDGDIGNVSSAPAPLEVKEEEIPKGRDIPDLPSRNISRIDIGEKSLELGESILQDERHFKIENGSGGKDERTGQFEAERKSYNGGSLGSSMSSRSSNSSSDNENHGIQSSQATVDIVSVADSLPGKSVKDNIHGALIKDHGNIVSRNVPGADPERNSEQAEVEAVFTEDSTLAPHVIQSVIKENGGERLIHVKEKVGTSEQITNAASEREGEEIAQSVENISAPYNPKEQEIAQENDHRLSIPQCAPAAVADEGATTESLLDPSTWAVQQTSWKSCCGLFDVFSGAGA